MHFSATYEADEIKNIGNAKVDGCAIISNRISAKTKILEDELFIVSMDRSGNVFFAINGTKGEIAALQKHMVLGYYRKTNTCDKVPKSHSTKSVIAENIYEAMKELGFIRVLK